LLKGYPCLHQEHTVGVSPANGFTLEEKANGSMLPNRLQKELLKRHIGPFFFCFFTIMFILLMQFLILYVDQLVGKGLTTRVVIELILNNLAYMVVLAVPMAVLVSSLIAFGRFAEWNELTALKAAGVNPFSLIKPLLFLALLLFIGLSYFSNNILPEANHKARSLFIDIRMQKPAFDLQPGIFYDGIEGYTFLVQHIPADSDTLYDITLFKDTDRNRNQAFIKAEKGWLESPDDITLSLFLKNGSIIRQKTGARADEGTTENSTFERHRISFDLSDMVFSRTNPEQRGRNDRTMSSRAMMAVIDTLQNEKEKQLNEHFDRSRNRLMPERDLSSLEPRPIQFGPADSLWSYQSDYYILNLMRDGEEQSRIITQSISAITDMRNEVENLAQNVRWRDFRIAEYTVEVHKKFSIPFACLIFVLIGAPIGMMTRKGNIGFAAIISAILLTLYFIAVIQGEKWADRMFISPFFGMWGINIIMGTAGILLTLHVSSSLQLNPFWRRKT